ncbi:hypothetical protein [Acinetobacter sp.]|uniref:hypothetical protein n=1 Tax=Acinetobacter sp. TaxID=472 RepID=UPI00388E72C3
MKCNKTMDWVGASLVEMVGGQGNAEIVISRAFTSSIGANCYLPECKAYGHSSECGLFWYDEDDRQFKKCNPTAVVMLADLEKELKQVAA